MFFKRSIDKFKSQTNILFQSRFLAALSPLQRYEFLQLCHRRTYREHEYIYYRNDPGIGMYFIENGRVELFIETPDENGNTQEVSFEVPEGESFGDFSTDDNEMRRLSSARCLTDCTLLGFFEPDFRTLKRRHPAIAVQFLETLNEILAHQLETATGKLEEVLDPATAFRIRMNSLYISAEKEQVE